METILSNQQTLSQWLESQLGRCIPGFIFMRNGYEREEAMRQFGYRLIRAGEDRYELFKGADQISVLLISKKS